MLKAGDVLDLGPLGTKFRHGSETRRVRLTLFFSAMRTNRYEVPLYVAKDTVLRRFPPHMKGDTCLKSVNHNRKVSI